MKLTHTQPKPQIEAEQERSFIADFRHRFLVRRINAGDNLEIFLVAAIASVLLIRLGLELTGYPQIGGGGLHIAHMLWGGLMMFFALVVLFCLVGRTAERCAAILGGIGFGTFIDEVGKFITSDNDYFFRPAISIIYICFVLIFILVRAVQTGDDFFTRHENMINALREIEEVAIRDLDADERRVALKLLSRSDTTHPLVIDLKRFLERVKTPSPARRSWFAWAKKVGIHYYNRVAGWRWFPPLMVLFFVGQLVAIVIYTLILIFFVGLGRDELLDVRVIGQIAERMKNLTFVDWVEVGCFMLSACFTLWGIFLMRVSRVRAFRMFERSILVAICLTQVFAFYKEQFSALLGLLLNIAIYAGLRLMIEEETRRRATVIQA